LTFAQRKTTQLEADCVFRGELADVLKRFSNTSLPASLTVLCPWLEDEAISGYVLHTLAQASSVRPDRVVSHDPAKRTAA
jgi:hypothetical protein